MTSPSSLVDIEPEPSLSKRLKTSRNDWICSSDRASTGVLAEPGLLVDLTPVLIFGGADYEGGFQISSVVTRAIFIITVGQNFTITVLTGDR